MNSRGLRKVRPGVGLLFDFLQLGMLSGCLVQERRSTGSSEDEFLPTYCLDFPLRVIPRSPRALRTSLLTRGIGVPPAVLNQFSPHAARRAPHAARRAPLPVQRNQMYFSCACARATLPQPTRRRRSRRRRAPRGRTRTRCRRGGSRCARTRSAGRRRLRKSPVKPWRDLG